MIRRHIVKIAASTLVAASMVGSASAQRTFATKGQAIRAGVVLLESSYFNPVLPDVAEPISATPHIWFNLDSNRSVKPAGWTFVNPHAPTTLTVDQKARWTRIEKVRPPFPATLGAPGATTRLTKRTAPYWEVRLKDFGDAQLADYDVLVVSPVVSPSNQLQLNPSEREKLRRFVDRGGILWIDPSALPTNSIDLGNSFPIPYDIRSAANSVEFKDFTQPLLTSPQQLSLRDVTQLSITPGNGNYARDIVPPESAGPGPLDLFFAEAFAGLRSFKPVIGAFTTLGGETAPRFSTGVARIGDGFVVLTSRAVAMKLNRVLVTDNYRYDSNLNFFARDANLQADGLAAAKLAINMISLSREYGQVQGGPQRTSSSTADVEAPLLKRAADTTIAGTTTAPALYKGLLVVSAGNQIVVYDADPARDFDGDGNQDDGVADTGVEGRDVIWQSNFTAGESSTLSSPVCIEIPASNVRRQDGSYVTDQVIALDNLGRLHALDLIRYTPQGTLDGLSRKDMNSGGNYVGAAYPLDPPNNSGNNPSSKTGEVYSPTVHENVAYIVERVDTNSGLGGRVWMVDLINGLKPAGAGVPVGREWFLGGNAVTMPRFSAPGTIGYIPILDNSGGTDRILYAPIESIPSSGGGPVQPAGFASIWLGARGEKPTDYEPQGTNTASALQVTTRAARDGLPIYTPGTGNPSPFGVRLTLMRTDGSVYSAQQMANVFQGTPTQSAGILSFTFATGRNQLPADVTGIRVDYSIDYGFGTGGELANAKRGDVFLPDQQTAPSRDILGSIALTPRGTIYMTTSDGSKSALYGFREEGRGAFKCVMRYELYGEHRMGGQGIADTTVPPTFVDGDPTRLYAPPFLDNPFRNFTIVGPPAVRGDVVYVAASGIKPTRAPLPTFNIDAAVLMAFKAEPETTTLYVENFPANGAIVQPDLARSVVPTRPEVSPTFQVGQTPGMTYDPDTKLLRIENLSAAPKGQLQAVLSLSQPILIRTPGGATPDRLVYPNGVSGANRFDPLLWFTVLNGFRPSKAGLAVTGNTLFMAGASRVRGALQGIFPPPEEGMMYAINTDISPNDPFLASMNTRPWMKQALQIRTMAGPGNPAQKWPDIQHIASFDDYLVRLSQTIVPGGPVVSMAAGEGVLAAVGTAGLFTYSRSDFVVADQGRIAMFDPSGNPTFEMTATGNAGDDEIGSAGTAQPIVRPSRAYPLSTNDILVADPGANRVFRMNRAGTETRAIAKFQLDPQHAAPANYPANGPKTLKGPNDVLTYTTIQSSASVQNSFTSTGAAYEYWTHYLIADTGNQRIVEVVDRYEYEPVGRRIGNVVEIGGKPQIGMLYWQSPPATQGRRFDFNSLSRVWVGTRYVYVAGIGSVLPTSTDTGNSAPNAASLRETAGFGGVAVFDPQVPNGLTVFNKVGVPAFSANVFWNDVTGAFDSAARAGYEKPLVNVSSVTARPVRLADDSTVVNIMITDASGVYEVTYAPVSGGGEYVPAVQWMLPNEVYRVMRRGGAGNGIPTAGNPRDLRATYARRLESGEVLVVNGYFGQTRGDRNANGTFSNRQPFRGEVVQVSGESGVMRTAVANMGFGLRSITFYLETNTGTRGLVLPVFADRR